MDYPIRKQIRIPHYDYGQNGAYFVTICTHNRAHLFGEINNPSLASQMIDQTFQKTIGQHSGVSCPKYVIMPDHFHAIIMIDHSAGPNPPTLAQIIQDFKRYSTLEYIKLVNKGLLPRFEKHIWQRSYYDHVIRNQQDFDEIWQYIENNPVKWKLDKDS